MDIYTVEIDGMEYDLEGDREPTEQEARAAIGEQKQPQPVQEQTAQEPIQDPTQQERPSMLASALRGITRSSVIEQAKTSEYLMGKMPDPKEGESYRDYQKRVSKVLEPREREIAMKGSMAQLETPVLGMLAMSSIKNPIHTLKALLKFSALEYGVDKAGVNNAIDMIKNPELKDIADIVKTVGEGGLAAQKWSIPKLAKASSDFAGNVINSLIKPRHKEFMFGKDPGGAVAKEGIVAWTMEGLATKIQKRIDTRMGEISNIRSNPKYADTKIDARNSIKPLVETYSKLKKMGKKTHAPELARIEKAVSDIKSSQKDLRNLTVSEAYQLKEAVGSMQNWTSDSPASKAVNMSVRRTYHNIDSVIDRAIPPLRPLNAKVSSLISAKNATLNRIEKLRTSEPVPSVGKLVNLPFAGFKSVIGKTLLGKVIAQEKPQVTSVELLQSLLGEAHTMPNAGGILQSLRR